MKIRIELDLTPSASTDAGVTATDDAIAMMQAPMQPSVPTSMVTNIDAGPCSALLDMLDESSPSSSDRGDAHSTGQQMTQGGDPPFHLDEFDTDTLPDGNGRMVNAGSLQL